MSARVPTMTMINRLLKANITPQANPEAHASFDVAFEAIRALDAERWTKFASDASHAKAQSLGAQLGWIPRDYSGCPQIFKSMQIDLCQRLDAMDVLEGGPAKRIAQEALIAEIRRYLTRSVLGADQRQRGRVDAVRPAAPPVPAAAQGEESPF